MPDLGPVQHIAKLNCLRFQVRDSASPDSAISVIPSYVHLVAAGSDNVGTPASFILSELVQLSLAIPFTQHIPRGIAGWGT
jgi:hypothetical protein